MWSVSEMFEIILEGILLIPASEDSIDVVWTVKYENKNFFKLSKLEIIVFIICYIPVFKHLGMFDHELPDESVAVAAIWSWN